MISLSEAQKIACIMESADGGCQHCATSLMEDFIEEFPQFKFEFNEDYYESEDFSTPMFKVAENEQYIR